MGEIDSFTFLFGEEDWIKLFFIYLFVLPFDYDTFIIYNLKS